MTTSKDRSARLWDLNGKELAVLRGHGSQVAYAAFSADGDRIVTGSVDGVRTWLVRTEDLVALADRRVARDFTRDERERFADVLGDDNAVWIEAYRAVDKIVEDVRLVAAVRNRLEQSADIPDRVRELALRIVNQRGDDLDAVRAAAWDIVYPSGGDPAAYKRARSWMEGVCEQRPDQIVAVQALGVARYRDADHAGALAALAKADEARTAKGALGVPATVCFMAMALHRLGRADDARRQLERGRGLIASPDYSSNEFAAAVLVEAEAQIEGGTKK